MPHNSSQSPEKRNMDAAGTNACKTLISTSPNSNSISDVRLETDKAKIKSFMAALGKLVRGNGRIYLTGGTTAVLQGWRPTTIDIDLKPEREPAGLFEAIAVLKEELEVNIKLAGPDQFIPAIPGWVERSLFIATHGLIEFLHYDPYGQALSKLQRRHERDLQDVQFFLSRGLIQTDQLRKLFDQIEPELIRYPALSPASFRGAVTQFCDENR